MPGLAVVVAPDSFKGSASAATVAAAVAEGWRSVRPGDHVAELPLADGGEGTLDAVEAALPDCTRHRLEVPGPDGRPVTASWLMLPDGTAVAELASASGLGLMATPAPYDAHTRGLGRVLADALDAGARRLVVGLGGSASTDGGAGVLTELGARLLDSLGEPVVDGSHGLAATVRVDLSGLRPLPVGGVQIWSDVTAPLLGPGGAASVFGPQKGATPDDVLALERALEGLAVLVDADPSAAGAGAAGGTGFGMLLWGATVVSGAEAVAEIVGLDRLVTAADLVVTGEGRFDEQTAGGKLVSWVASSAHAHDVPVALVAGQVAAGTAGFADVVDTSVLAGGTAGSTADPRRWLVEAGALLAARATARSDGDDPNASSDEDAPGDVGA
ncbi:glycerate kinase [Frigoribacterium sp. PvP032]|uniref:glycerate kinase n=1 Tax=Frigoribacterium sp. PvP032 TaxID=2806589 RepID=UPI001AEA5C3E|nr:glycerate kinase [Frigoribacterium sp. PvP032]MBP1191385.1 glycerate kinase [Frigoribacterium sp. PvP032]